METKKTNRANLEKKRSLFFQIGLLTALGFIFVAFEWQAAPRISDITWDIASRIDIDDIDMIRTKTPEVPPPAPALPSHNLAIVDNTVELDNSTLIIDVEPVGNILPEDLFTSSKLDEEPEPDFFIIVEDPPLFNGKPAEIGFREYIKDHLDYPAVAIENGIFGTVFVEFIVDAKGNVTDAKVMRGADPVLDKEALRLIMASPQWTPGKQREKPVKVKYTFPIVFRLR
ncbi:MAG: energy transducer TonB [Bacteroidales bacterium]|jgi:protein TonB|nr:energy transducer TonB [Bacteroidales bacterium]